jgi:hypothetical protein
LQVYLATDKDDKLLHAANASRSPVPRWNWAFARSSDDEGRSKMTATGAGMFSKYKPTPKALNSGRTIWHIFFFMMCNGCASSQKKQTLWLVVWPKNRWHGVTCEFFLFCSIDYVHELAKQLRIHNICLLIVSTSVRSLWYPPFSELQKIRCLTDLLKKKNKKLCAAILKQSLRGGMRDLELHYWEASKWQTIIIVFAPEMSSSNNHIIKLRNQCRWCIIFSKFFLVSNRILLKHGLLFVSCLQYRFCLPCKSVVLSVQTDSKVWKYFVFF